MKKKYKKGFTLAELLIAVAIIGVLVAVAIPVFSNQLEKSREATDLANVRAAYAEVMSAAIVQDTSSPLYTTNGTYLLTVPLKQTKDDWTLDREKLVVGGVSSSDNDHWLNKPRAKGRCKVYYMNDSVFFNWCGEDHINSVSASDFLTKEILQSIVGKNYQHAILNSNEPLTQNGGTKEFINYAKEHGFDLNDYGATT